MTAASTPLVPVHTDPPQSSDAPVSAELSAETVQEPGGIACRLRVTNRATGDVELDNPYDSARYQITDADGWPITVAAPVSRARRGPNADPADKAPYLLLTGVDQEGSVLEGGDAVGVTHFTLAAGSTITFMLEIRTILGGTQRDTPQPPGVGEYHLTFIGTIRWSMAGSRSDLSVKSQDSLTVHLEA